MQCEYSLAYTVGYLHEVKDLPMKIQVDITGMPVIFLFMNWQVSIYHRKEFGVEGIHTSGKLMMAFDAVSLMALNYK